MNDNIFEDAIITMTEKTPAEGDYTVRTGLSTAASAARQKQFRMESGPMTGKLFPPPLQVRAGAFGQGAGRAGSSAATL